jgi:hypothetical protein
LAPPKSYFAPPEKPEIGRPFKAQSLTVCSKAALVLKSATASRFMTGSAIHAQYRLMPHSFPKGEMPAEIKWGRPPGLRGPSSRSFCGCGCLGARRGRPGGRPRTWASAPLFAQMSESGKTMRHCPISPAHRLPTLFRRCLANQVFTPHTVGDDLKGRRFLTPHRTCHTFLHRSLEGAPTRKPLALTNPRTVSWARR